MKFHVKTSDFQKAISAVEGVITVREVRSILSNIKIEAEDDKISLSATDLEISLKTSIPAAIISAGVGTIPAKQLSNTMKSINFPETALEVSLEEEGSMRTLITDAQSKVDFKMLINGIDGEEMKTIGKIDSESKKEIPCATLAQMIKKTSYSVALEDTRYVFNGLYLTSTPDKLIIVATDGRRLAKIERDIVNHLPFEKGVIIPHKAIREISKMIESSDSGFMGFIENQVYLNVKDAELLCKLIDGNYPDYEAVIPKETKFLVRVNKDNLMVTLRQAMIAAEEPSKQIRLGFSNNLLNISSSTPGTTEVSINIPIDYDGEEMAIAFKGDYLSDVVKSIDDTEIEIRFNNPNSPVLFRDPSDDRYISVIMPMKL
jgi:DNA polymerase III subunit beta